MYKILTLNNISVVGLKRLPRESYEIASEIQNPDAIILRSYKMHDMDVPETVAAIGRAGAGTNNIPVDAMAEKGVPVFNAPGANANAVKELAIAGLMIAARNICDAREFVKSMEATGDELNKQVEAAKKQFVGFELPKRRLGVIGLGAIGVQVANAALELGMDVVGYDPGISVKSAWQLSAGVEQAETLDQLFQKADAVTVHVPLMDATRGIVDKDRISLMNDDAVVVNFARGGVVNDVDAIEAMDSGKLHAYVTDFPTAELIAHPKAICLPHLGASTGEAEENCAVMVADQVKDFLENGNIRNSVNFPAARLPRSGGYRITIANKNVPNMVGQISTTLADAGLNIDDLLNKSLGDLAYTIVDVNEPIGDDIEQKLRDIPGVLRLRNLGAAAS